MTLELTQLITYLTIGLLVYYFVLELSKPKKGAQNWVSWAFVGGLLVLAGYFLWSSWSSQKGNGGLMQVFRQESSEEDLPEVVVSEEEEVQQVTLPQMYITQNKTFQLTDKGSTEMSPQVSYQDFKEWYLSPDFVEKFTVAVKNAMKIKRRRLTEEKRRYTADLAALQRKDKGKNSLAGLLDMSKNDQTKTIENAIGEMDALLKEIAVRERKLTPQVIKENLISAVTDSKHGIDTLTGRESVKDFLALQLYTFAQNPRIFFSNFQNLAIYGPPGIGKTKLAQVIGHVYAASGILIRNHVHIVTKKAMTTAYVDESAKMTERLLLGNLESVVFIDEAYDMTPPISVFGQGIDHGHEAITELVNFTDKMKGLSIIIVAGYKEEMEERFMNANKGLPRRFPVKLELTPYDSKALTDILITFMTRTTPGLKVSSDQANFLYTIVSSVNKEDPKMFEFQASDMEHLSSHICKAMVSLPDASWEDDWETVIKTGVNSYLGLKGAGIKEVA